MAARFPLGRLVPTPGSLALLADTGTDPIRLLSRHAVGDWGSVPADDARGNDLSVREGFRIISSYPLPPSEARLWIITEADRSATTLLLAEEH